MRHLSIMLAATTALTAAPLFAQSAPAVDAEAIDASEIVVIGKGETRQVSELQPEAIAVLVAGTSPLKAISKLPSVNFQAADAFGAYEWSQRVSIRSFNQNQLGFTLDGVPLGDASYGNTNGLHISRAISSENVGRVVVAQGQGSIGAQATNNLGGTIETFSRAPDDVFGLTVNGTVGSDETYRGFVRMDTGEFLGGARGYLSYGYLKTDKWKGFGQQRQHAVNAKVDIPIGGATLTGYAAYSGRVEQDYQDLSLDSIRRLGYNLDNISNDFATAVRIADVGANRGDTGATRLNPAAGLVYPAPFATVDDVYFDASGLRRDYLVYLGLEAPLSDAVTLSIKPYYHNNHGQGTWFTPYVPSPTGVPISVRTTEYDINRKGVFGSVAASFSGNDLTVGAWYEKNDFHQARRFYALASRTAPGRSAREFQVSPFATQWEFDFATDTFQYYVDDTLTLGDLKINIGWKGFRVINRSTALIADGRAAGRISATDWFQPRAGATYAFMPELEGYLGFAQATRAFTSATTSGPFATTQAGFNAIRSTLRPEQSDTYETGLRYKSGRINASLGAYYVNFRNRLLAFTTGAGIVGNPAILQNVGAVRSYGVEAAVDVRIGDGFGVYAAYSYNDSTYRNNVVNAANVVVAATAGKTVVDAPRHLLKGEVSYDRGTGIFGRIGVDYMSKRFFNYENDRSVGARALVEATLGYRFDGGMFKDWVLQANMTNVFDLKYVSTIGSNGFGNRGDNQTLLSGAPRQVFVTLKTRI